ncbi:MBL fold metallo-hydrolase [Streptomyces liangshanensis]|uniref:MBL fold metallo-hydrolase n=1 Tax=Streptomyces liangshanensis TaxID=2717324 RepID=A0A6G9GTK9_9ACTN|nr:MBL fold metallo-hydrolase [Streptomyces liangshanensis]QIQ01277.1 MBL fold metallo-hydrolase [Streptomyces liangshanensis]
MGSIDIGDVSVTRVFEWAGDIATREQLIPSSDRRDWEANASLLVPDFWDPATESVKLCVQTFVVKSGGRTILVDTGIGNDKERLWFPTLRTEFLDLLTKAGAAPEEVDLVVATHLHTDHVGWNTTLTDGRWVPTFPNATYLFPQEDFDYWNPEGDDEPPGGPAYSDAFKDSVLPVVHAGQAQFFSGEHVIDGNVSITPAPGHSPGSAVVEVTSRGESALFTGDLVHSPMQILGHEHASCFDDDPARAATSRDRVLHRASETRAAVFTAHFDVDKAARIARQGGRYVVDSWTELD